jgi:serine/threonine protein kinase
LQLIYLGDGAGGIVIACFDTNTQINIAVKKISSIFDGDVYLMKRICRELRLLRLLSCHQNIVSLKDVYLYDQDLYLVMEMLNTDLRKDLFFSMKKNNSFDPMKTRYIMYGALRALQYIHNRGVLHRDMKPSNILLSNSKVVVCDFGHANTIRSIEGMLYFCCIGCD